MDQLGHVADSLHELEASARRLEEKLNAEIMHQGLASLPDEVFLRIITHARDEDFRYLSNLDILDMAAVCRRFRDTIFTHAPFWASICNLLDTRAIVTALARSKNAPLTVSIYHRESGTAASTKFLDFMWEHRHRLSTVDVSFQELGGRYGNWQSIRDVLSKLARMDFPAMGEFRMDSPPFFAAVHVQEVNGPLEKDHDLYHVYTKWSAPSLAYLSLENIVPQESTRLHLTSLELYFENDLLCPVDDPLAKLMSFIKSQSSLERLSISIAILPVEDDFRLDQPIHLPNLRSLSVSARDEGYCDDAEIFFAHKIVHSLLIPAVEDMKLQFSIKDDQFTMESIFPQDRQYPRAERLSFCLRHVGYFSHRLSPFKSIFAKFPKLKYLNMVVFDSQVDGEVPSISAHPPPPLKVFHIEKAVEFHLGALKKVFDHLSCGPHWQDFRELRLCDCPYITPSGVASLGILPMNKIRVIQHGRL